MNICTLIDNEDMMENVMIRRLGMELECGTCYCAIPMSSLYMCMKCSNEINVAIPVQIIPVPK